MRYRSVESVRSQGIVRSCLEAEKYGLPYIREKDIKVVKMQYEKCDGRVCEERDAKVSQVE